MKNSTYKYATSVNFIKEENKFINVMVGIAIIAITLVAIVVN